MGEVASNDFTNLRELAAWRDGLLRGLDVHADYEVFTGNPRFTDVVDTPGGEVRFLEGRASLAGLPKSADVEDARARQLTLEWFLNAEPRRRPRSAQEMTPELVIKAESGDREAGWLWVVAYRPVKAGKPAAAKKEAASASAPAATTSEPAKEPAETAAA